MAGSDLSPEIIEAVERGLAQHIGPMARVLVRKTVPRAASRIELYELLAQLIPDPAPRAAFMSGLAGGTTGAAPATRSRPLATGAASAATPPADGGVAGGISDELLAQIEKLFARHIGPMARVLVRREARSADSPESLCRALASHIDKPAERLRFLNDAGY